MNTSRWIRIALILWACTVSIPQLWANSTERTVATDTKNAPPSIEKMHENALSLLGNIRNVIELCAHVTSSGELQGTTSSDVIASLTQLNALIMHMTRSLAQPDIQSLEILIRLEEAIISYLGRALDTSFSQIKPFDPTPIFKRTPQDADLSEKTLVAALARNKKNLGILAKKSTEIGLRWYNHAYRTFDKWVVQPADKYSIPRRAAILAGSIGFGLWLWRHLDEAGFAGWCLEKNAAEIAPFMDTARFAGEVMLPQSRRSQFLSNLEYKPLANLSWLGKINRWTRQAIFKLYGPIPRSSQGSPELTAEDFNHLSWLGKLENGVQKINAGMYPIFAAILYFTWNAAKEDIANGYEWIATTASEYANRLKGGAYIKEAEKIAARSGWGTSEEVYFDDLVGLEHVKHVFQQIVDYLENPEHFERMNCKPPKGILLMGDTRTGKSHSVKALFCEVQRMLQRKGRGNEFKLISLQSSMVNKYGMENILRDVKAFAPCILFIDEIDLLQVLRLQGSQNEVLSSFLRLMGETLNSNDPGKQVFIIGATNKPEALDKALRAPGRFGKIMNFTYPSLNDRKEFIRKKLQKLLLLDTDLFDINMLAQLTEKKSFEDLNTIIDTALLNAQIKRQGLSQEHIIQALNEEVRRVITHGEQELPESQKQIIAAHFAGKALLLELLNMPLKLADVTIRPVLIDIQEEAMGAHLWGGKKDDPKEETRTEHGRVFTYHHDDNIDVFNKTDKLNMCKYYLAGFEAENILIGSCGYSCNVTDSNRSMMLAQTLAFEGLDVARLPQYLQKEMFNKALTIRDTCRSEVHALLLEHKETLSNIQKALIKHQTLSAQQVRDIMAGDLSLVEDPKPVITETDSSIDIDLGPLMSKL